VRRLREIVPYAVLLAVAAFLYAQTGAMAAFSRPGQLGPDAWPKAILALLVFVCVFEVARRLWSWRSARAQAKREAVAAEPQAPRYPWLLAAGVAITILYVPALSVLGFFLSTVIYLAAFMRIGRYRSIRVIAACSVLGSLAFVFVFMKIVYVSLPLGMGPFRAFSAWLLAVLGIH
jgi:putative tricarboxylic transport membrane protein